MAWRLALGFVANTAYCTNNSPVCSLLRRLGKSADMKTKALSHTNTYKQARTPAEHMRTVDTNTSATSYKWTATCSCMEQIHTHTLLHAPRFLSLTQANRVELGLGQAFGAPVAARLYFPKSQLVTAASSFPLWHKKQVRPKHQTRSVPFVPSSENTNTDDSSNISFFLGELFLARRFIT